jgi:IS30 family transposase
MERPEVQEYVEEGLKQYWSPEQIAGRSQRDFSRRCDRVSHETIYAWIKTHDHRRRWERFLRFGGRRRTRPDRRGKRPPAMRMDHRPEVVDRRSRYGDWEGDTIVGKQHRGTILTQVERKSGYLLASKLSRRGRKNVRCASLRRLGKLPATLRKTMTFDNGPEFSDPARWADQLQMEVYLTDPGAPWQRGTNENTNGLLRQFFPKGIDLREVSRAQLRQAENLLNDRPRKRLGYRTPRELLAKYLDVAFEN